MRQLLVLCWAIILCPFISFSQQVEIPLIPKPNKMVYGDGGFNLTSTTPLYVTEGFASLTPLLLAYPNLTTLAPEIVKKLNKKHNQGIRLFQAEAADKLAENAYRIIIDQTGILIKAPNTQTMRSALLTLLQIGLLQDNPQQLPAVTIEDSPRFSYRGLHLDVSRHFMPFAFVKKYIDIMALYKFNYFHWHLTDGAGWRLEIKQYPELTSKAAWRTHIAWKDWRKNGRQFIEQGAPNAYGGFYTQAQVKEIVAYAAEKGITIIPEIEFPGHSEEVLAVYPELSCAGTPYSQGEFCIGNPETFKFMKNVLDEVLTLFPSEYIHVGGDEANKKHWEKCPKCQALKAQENLKDEHELQSYGIRQLDEYLQAKNRKLIGWDEILEGGLTKGATVMSWRGEEGGIKAANAGHDVIMTPQTPLYFDSYQSDPRTQPEAIGGYVTIDQVYAYNPIPKGVDKEKEKHILGAQANLWTEYMPTFQQVEYMAFPRALALAEVNWTNQSNRSWEDFKARLQKHIKLLQQLDINYYRPSYNVKSEVTFHPNRMSNTVSLSSEQVKPVIYYTTDGSEPTRKSTIYTNPVELTGSLMLRAASFLDSARVSPVEDVKLDVHKAIGKKVYYNTPWAGYPAQKEATLTNGAIGGLSYHDQQWQGFTQPIDLYIDFERREEIKSVAMRFMQLPGPGIYFPGTFKVLLSDNGKNYREIGELVNNEDASDPKLKFKLFELKLDKPLMGRYVRVQASNPMNGYLFTDELIVY